MPFKFLARAAQGLVLQALLLALAGALPGRAAAEETAPAAPAPAAAPAEPSVAQAIARGQQLLLQQKFEEAARAYGYAVSKDPRNADAYAGLGYASMGKKDNTNGVAYLEYALKLKPDDKGVRDYLAKAYQSYGNQSYQRGDKAVATSWWEKSVKTDPSNTQLSAYLAMLKANGGNAPSGISPPGVNPTLSVKGSSLGINPWMMGAATVVLGAVLLFVF